MTLLCWCLSTHRCHSTPSLQRTNKGGVHCHMCCVIISIAVACMPCWIQLLQCAPAEAPECGKLICHTWQTPQAAGASGVAQFLLKGEPAGPTQDSAPHHSMQPWHICCEGRWLDLFLFGCAARSSLPLYFVITPFDKYAADHMCFLFSMHEHQCVVCVRGQ